MYASMFRLEVGSELSVRECGRLGRTLAAQLAALPGVVAFIAVKATDGVLGGLCICSDAQTLTDAQHLAETWQHEHDAMHPPLRTCVSGQVVVQHGF